MAVAVLAGLLITFVGWVGLCFPCLFPSMLLSFPLYGGAMTTTPEAVTPLKVAISFVANVGVFAFMTYPLCVLVMKRFVQRSA